MRRPIPKVTEQRGGGHAIELSHVRPDRQAPAVIGSTIGGHARRNRPVGSIRPYCRRLTARQLADTAIAQPLWPLIAQPIAPTPERPPQHPSVSAVSSATAHPAHAARAALRNASAVPLAALPPGPFPAPFSDASKPDHALPEPNSSRGTALSVPPTCRSNRRLCSRASASILAAANGVIDWLSAISRTCLSFSLNKPTFVLTFCLS